MIMHQHPADRGEADDDGNGNRPGRHPDVADGLAFGLVLGNLAVARLVVFGFAHRPPSARPSALSRSAPTTSGRLSSAPAVVDGRKAASNTADGSAASRPLPPRPASRLKASAASA